MAHTTVSQPSGNADYRVVLHMFSVVVFCVSVGLAGAGEATPEFATRMNGLQEKLDSIDMEKQIRKRKGQALEDLEKTSLQLKDSIAEIRKTIGQTSGASDVPPAGGPRQTQSPNVLKRFQQYFPQNAFDWVVLIVGFVAIIAGIVLCFGIVGMFRGKAGKTKKPALHTMRDISPQTEQTADSEFSAKAARQRSEVFERRVDSLRQRINEGRVDLPLHEAGRPIAKQEAPGTPAADTLALKKLIIKASREGADIPEISRRFHVGIDQVTLVLRVAREEGETEL